MSHQSTCAVWPRAFAAEDASPRLAAADGAEFADRDVAVASSAASAGDEASEPHGGAWELRLLALERRITEIERRLGLREGVEDHSRTLADETSGEIVSRPADPLPATTDDETSEDLEDSVKDCIERLLQRLNTPAHEKPLVETTAGVAVSAVLAERAEPEGSDAEVADPAADEWLAEEANSDDVAPELEPEPGERLENPYAPLSLPPERTANLAAMRELANVSAESAIRSFERARAMRRAVDKIPVLLVALFCGGFLLYSALSYNQLLVYAAAVLGLTVAAVTAWQIIDAFAPTKSRPFVVRDARRPIE